MLSRNRTLLVLLAGLLIVGGAIVIRVLIDDDDDQAPPAAERPACGTVAADDATGAPLPAVWRDLVTGIHDAACRGDLTAVESYMGEWYEGDRGDVLGVNGGGPLTVLAETLEQPGDVSQGGLTYCHPRGASAIFARDVPGVDAGWTAFWLHDPHDLCP